MKRSITLLIAISILNVHGAEIDSNPFNPRNPMIDYHKDVSPILRDYCGGCHNESEYEGEFSIETFQSLMKGGESGKPIITPGKPADSYFLATILHEAKPAMPPKKEPQLSSEEIAILTTWVEQGAKGPAPEKDLSILSTLNVPSIPGSDKNAKPVTALAFSQDGKLSATGRYGRVEIGDLVIKVEGKVNAIHFSGDGKQIIIATGTTGLRGVATIHDAATGKELLRIGEGTHRDILYDAEFSPDGKLIATAGYDRAIHLWDATTGALLRKIAGHNGAIFDLAFSPDSTLLASASADETGKIWRVADGERLDTLNQPEGEQFRITFTPDGKHIVAVGGDKKIRLWQLVSKTAPKINPVIHSRFAHEAAINEMAMSNDGKWLATTSEDGFIKIWTLPDLNLVKTIGDQPDLVSALKFGPDKTLLAGRMDGSIVPCTIGDLTGYSPRSVAVASSRHLTDEFVLKRRLEAAATANVPFKEFAESDAEVLPIDWPAKVSGKISAPNDTDDYLFSARKDETIILEINAAKSKSMLDSKIEVLSASGEKIERLVLQAVRESWFTFRGKDSDTSDDFRVHNWEEMELNEYLYANGEVVKFWHYPRGPDSGFRVYPGFGNRQTWFDTTPLSHPLGGPCYIVEAYAPGTTLSPNGLPIYRLFWENDDDSARVLGSDSRLSFTAPADGSYRVRVSDVRGFGGENFNYQLTVRPANPDFSITHNGAKLKISPGSGNDIEFTATPLDGFEGDIHIQPQDLPPGFSANPVTIQAGQRRAYMAIHAAADVVIPPAEALAKIAFTASGEIDGKTVSKTLPGLPELAISKAPKLTVGIFPDGPSGKFGPDGGFELTIRPGETVSALVRASRIDFKGIVNFGKDESGRNLPHGLYVDNVGLSGLMIPEGLDEQRFWITASKWMPEMEWTFHLRASEDGGHTTVPARIRVVK